MVLYKCLLTENECYIRNRQLFPVRGVMVHSTGANNPNIKRYVQPASNRLDFSKDIYDPSRSELIDLLGVNHLHNDWNHPGIKKCVHAFIGKLKDGSVAAVQTLPWDKKGWHAGTGTSGRSANDTHIGFEICEDDLRNPDYFHQTYQTAVELTAYLCREYQLNPLKDGVIICHREGYKRGIASQHADVLHWWPRYGYTMDNFRQDVYKALGTYEEDNMTYYRRFEDVPEYYQEAIKKCIEKGGLQGTGDGELNISEDYCRIMTSLDRMGDL